MQARSYVLFAVSDHLRSATTVQRRLLTAIASAPESALAVAWAVHFFAMEKAPSRKTTEHLQRQLEIGLFPNIEGLPLWLSDFELRPSVSVSELDRPAPVPDTSLANRIDWLDDQSQVELLLALLGLKVSRLTLALRDAVHLQRVLGIPLVCGTDLVVAQTDAALPSFSNLAVRSPIATDVFPLLMPEQTIDIYISVDWRAAAICWALDRQDKAGELLGIPECCRRWFAANWEVCVKELEGDLAYCCLKGLLIGGMVSIPSATNPYAIYLGGSLLSHFPCSPLCGATMAAAEQRRLALSGVASGLLERVLHRHAKQIWVSQFRAVSTSDPGNVDGNWSRVTPMQ